jgi:glyoxylase-like metal-dependent hydrolase (beta-lactamase superfamily II)
MKIIRIAAICIAIIFLTTRVSAQSIDEIPIKVQKLSDRILLVKTGETSVMPNVSAIKSEEGIIIFDCHGDPGIAKKIRKKIQTEFGEKNIRYVINTHGAFDHTGGNKAFSDIDIIGHDKIPEEFAQMSKMLEDPKMKEQFDAQMKAFKRRLENLEKGSQAEKELNEFFIAFSVLSAMDQNFNEALPTITFSDRMTVHLKDLTLVMVHNVQSYSESDIVIYVPELKFMNVGDVFNKDRLPVINVNSDIPRWLEIFEELLEKGTEIEYVIGGHAGVMTMADVRSNLDYIKDLWEGIKSAKEQGLTEKEIKEKFSFEEFNHLTHVNPVNEAFKTNAHQRNIETILKMLNE